MLLKYATLTLYPSWIASLQPTLGMNHAVGSSSCPASAAESEDCASWWPSGPAVCYGGTFGSTTGALSEKRLPNPLRFHYLPSCFPMKVAASGGQLHFQTNLFDQGRKIGKCAEADTSGLCPNFWFQHLTFTVSLQKKPNFLQFSPLQLQ